MQIIVSSFPTDAVDILKIPEVTRSEVAPRLIDALIEKVPHHVLVMIAQSPHYQEHKSYSKWVLKCLEIEDNRWTVADSLAVTFLNADFGNSDKFEKLLKLIIDQPNLDPSHHLAKFLVRTEVRRHPKWLEVVNYAIDNLNEPAARALADEIFKESMLPAWSRLVDKLVSKTFLIGELTSLGPSGNVLFFEHNNWPSLMDRLIALDTGNKYKNETFQKDIIKILDHPKAIKHPRWHTWILKILDKNPSFNRSTLMGILGLYEAKQNPHWEEIIETVLRHKSTRDLLHPNDYFSLLSSPYFTLGTRLKEATGGNPVNVESLLEAFDRGFTFIKPHCSKLFSSAGGF